ncbi:RHS repeat protein [Paraburkholderia humisilvae]|uniref:RHS repeat protein n=1 Tax=Paraburkholderia humisilvae TaxID=627669 RepID=A0A6J5EPQ8_9BURK|nr:RHS repeat protein [Paraburkholderia humisilvae]CAB3767202.1 hypothetical protein LMG29542_05550 [Paraburkholderia humisilvae]
MQFAYGNGTTDVIDSRQTTRLSFSSIGGMLRPTGSSSSTATTASVWDASGNLLKDTTASDGTREYSYDGTGRPVRVVIKGPSATRVISMRYVDADGVRPAMIASPGKLRAFVYDANGNLSGYSERNTTDPTGEHGFDALWDGQQQRTTGVAYDSLNRVSRARVYVNGALTEDWFYFYDHIGNLNTAQNNVSRWMFGNQDRDASHRVTWQSGNYRSTRMVYDARGRLAQFTYDEQASPSTGGLARALTVNYGYSPDGEVATRTGTVTKNGGAPSSISSDEKENTGG